MKSCRENRSTGTQSGGSIENGRKQERPHVPLEDAEDWGLAVVVAEAAVQGGGGHEQNPGHISFCFTDITGEKLG